jgi:hypothetical protein
MRELLVGDARPGSEPVLGVARPGPDVETVRWGFEGDPAHLVADLAPGVRKVYFSNGPPPVEAPEKNEEPAGEEAPHDEAPLLLLLLSD